MGILDLIKKLHFNLERQCFSIKRSAYFLTLCTFAFYTCLTAYILLSFLEVALKTVEKFPVPR
jgi:hypothetical protein